MKRTFFLMPLLMPRVSDRAAVQLLDILEQLTAAVRHHYEPQIRRSHRRQRNLEPPQKISPPLFDDVPF